MQRFCRGPAFWNERQVAEEAYAASKAQEEDDEGKGPLNTSVPGQ